MAPSQTKNLIRYNSQSFVAFATLDLGNGAWIYSEPFCESGLGKAILSSQLSNLLNLFVGQFALLNGGHRAIDVSPDLSCLDNDDGMLGNTEMPRHRALPPESAKSANTFDLAFREFGVSRSFSACKRWFSFAALPRAKHIFFVCNPFEVFRSKIGFVAVFVIYLWQILWIWYERFGYKSVDRNGEISGISLPELDGWIAKHVDVARLDSHSPYSAKVRNFIRRTAGYCSPFFINAHTSEYDRNLIWSQRGG